LAPALAAGGSATHRRDGGGYACLARVHSRAGRIAILTIDGAGPTKRPTRLVRLFGAWGCFATPSDGGPNHSLARVGPTTPTRAKRSFDASVDPTEACSVAGFGPDDRGPTRVNWTLHSVSSPGRPNATLRPGTVTDAIIPGGPQQGLPGLRRGKPLPFPSRVPLQHRAPSAHRTNGSSGNTGS
jgi:hypothetical protein